MYTFEKNVIGTWGEKGKDWLSKLPFIIELMTKHWVLTDIKPVDNMSWNFVALANQKNNPVVLKISCDQQLIQDEYKALKHFAGHGAIKVLDINTEHNALLLEQAAPGHLLMIHHPINIKDTIHIYADIVKKISSQPLTKNDFTHVAKWCEAIDKIQDPRIEKRFIDKARILRDYLLNTVQKEYLCHGDLHLENIIQHRSEWLAIDPKGIVGEMAFEVAAFDLINKDEMDNEIDLAAKIIYRVTLLSNALELDFDRLLSWIFLRMIISAQWFVEDNGDPSEMLLLAKHVYQLLENTESSDRLPNPISFSSLKENHLPLLYQWFQETIVKKWYARGKAFTFDDIKTKYLPRIQRTDKTSSYIIYLNNKPIGFIQYYALCDHLPEGVSSTNKLFATQTSEKLSSLDIFIADANYRCKGFGVEILNKFIDELANKFSVVIVDPTNDNLHAIRCYQKCGFTKTDYSEDRKHLIMIKEL